MAAKWMLLVLPTTACAARSPMPRQASTCSTTSRFNVTQFRFNEDPNFGRHLDFVATHLTEPSRSYSCSMAKMYSGRNNVPQWNDWTYDGCDVVGNAPPTASGFEPRFSYKFSTARAPSTGLPKSQSMSISLQMQEEGAAAESVTVQVNMMCNFAEECDAPCNVADCTAEQFCL